MFANHLYDVCEKEECNFDSVILGLDIRIELYMGEGEFWIFALECFYIATQMVRGGFGGKCLPKIQHTLRI